MLQRLDDAKVHGLRRLYLAPPAMHAQSLWENKFDNDRILNAFLEDVALMGATSATEPSP